jgi:hypothetical protein
VSVGAGGHVERHATTVRRRHEHDSAGLAHLRRRTIRLISDFALSSVERWMKVSVPGDVCGWFSVSLFEGWFCGLQR